MAHTRLKGKDELLGTEGIGKLLARLSIPATIGLLVNALYNLVDTIFIGRGVGALGIGALAITFPVQIIIISTGVMIGVGASSIISRNLGRGNREKALRTAGNSFTLAITLGLLLMSAGYMFIDPILSVFGATRNIVPFAYDYLSFILPGSVFTAASLAGYYVLMSEGRSTEAMISMIIGAGMNCLLDPLFIFTFQMGIRGAACATIVSQALSFFYILFLFLTGKSSLRFTVQDLIPDRVVLKEMCALGFPVFIKQAAKSLFFVIVNNSLKYYGSDMDISAFGVIFRVLSFVLIPLLGIGQGLQPIIGYNYGAKKFSRIKKAIWMTIGILSVLSILLFIVLFLFSESVIRIFNSEDQLVAASIPALRMIILIIPLLGFHITGSIYFFAMGKPVPAFVLSLSRQILFLIPLVLLLPRFLGLSGIWLAFPLADFVSIMLAGIWLFSDMHKEGMFSTPDDRIKNCETKVL
jgi:putative MATE family efflux protein